MKFPNSHVAFLLLTLTSIAMADVPKKAPLSRYTNLYMNSPFTSKPPPAEAGPENNPLDDYALIGVSSIGKILGLEAHRVTLINKKKPEERITVTSADPKSRFKILGVTTKPGNPLDTVVTMASGAMTGTVAFDEKLLTIAAATPRAPVHGQQTPPGAPPIQPGMPMPQRQPRPRFIPPPPPGVAGQVPPAQPVQQNQPRAQRRSN
jgi:hypothetical protein